MTENTQPVSEASLSILTKRRRKRPDIIAEHIRSLIAERGLMPGDRLPQEWLTPNRFKASRGTLREAMKILEIQGLITSKTGPGGGAFISALTPAEAIQLLDNLFLFNQPSIADIYAMRKLLEPELAAGLAGKLTPRAFSALQATIRLYEEQPATAEEEYQQRLAELDFHAELARQSGNEILGFVCVFLLSLLREMTVCREILQPAQSGTARTRVALPGAAPARHKVGRSGTRPHDHARAHGRSGALHAGARRDARPARARADSGER